MGTVGGKIRSLVAAWIWEGQGEGLHRPLVLRPGWEQSRAGARSLFCPPGRPSLPFSPHLLSCLAGLNERVLTGPGPWASGWAAARRSVGRLPFIADETK